MSNFNVFFQMVLLYYGITLRRLVCFERMEKPYIKYILETIYDSTFTATVSVQPTSSKNDS